MSYLKRLKRTSKKVLVFKDNEYGDMPAVYVKAIKQDKKIWWMSKLAKFEDLQDSDNSPDVILEFVDLINTFVILTAVFEDGSKLGSFDEVDSVSLLPDGARKEILIKAAEVNRIDKKLMSHLVEFIDGLNEEEFIFEIPEEEDVKTEE